MEYKFDRNTTIKTKKLGTNKKKKLLGALERGIKYHPMDWTIKGYSLLKAAINEGLEITNPNVLSMLIGTPVLKGTGKFGYEHTLNLYFPSERLVIEIAKNNMYTDKIGFLAFEV